MVDSGVEQSFDNPADVGGIAKLYLGNILYALELASLSLEEQGKGQDAGFYRGIARKLADAHGASKAANAAGSAPARNT